ncbi:hypothetical protein BSKO_12653 [Bryopsis sp. KO-2023]|nr:hypothetical protein BSKO_12653 [Bryopsis sp. KO-2023]
MGKRSRGLAPAGGTKKLEPEPVDLDNLQFASDDEVEQISEGSGEESEEVDLDEGKDEEEDSGASLRGDDDSERGEARPDDPGSDSSEDERPNRNTVGDVPLEWYKHEDHIGYDLTGKKLGKQDRKDRLDLLLERMDNDGMVRTIYDEYNDEEVELTREELKMLMRIRKGKFPHVDVDPHWMPEPWFTSKPRIHPLISRPKPKARFIPSEHEEKIVLKLVREIRRGKLKPKRPKPSEPSVYLMWDDDAQPGERTAAGLSYIPAPKKDLPDHAESYNPSKEYLPTEEEREALEDQNALREGTEDNPLFIPKGYDSLRKVPAFERYINEAFERCLDLYLCPRAARKKPFQKLTSESFLPKLPKPRDLQPFPSMLYIKYTGHAGKIRSVAPDASGQWLASGGDDGALKIWEIRTGRCLHTWQFDTPVVSVAWCPQANTRVISAAAGKRVLLLPAEVGDEETREISRKVVRLPNQKFREEIKQPVSWVEREDKLGLEIHHKFLVKQVVWHCQGDYFVSVAPEGHSKAVTVHRLSKKASQNPFRKSKGKVVKVLFHPFKPILFVQSENNVRVYNLTKQTLIKKLSGSRGVMTSLAIHPGGDNLIVGGDDERLCWFDLDISSRPYKALKFHKQPIRSVAYHRSYPLFASASDDGTVQIFHGMVYNDLLTNAFIVPLKILKGHTITNFSGVLDCAFHPTQPWIFTAGADGTICLFCN